MTSLPQKLALSLPKRPAGRVSLAIGLSLLAHAIVLFAPLVRLPPVETPLPPLTAKLEPLPRTAAKPAIRKPRPRPQQAPPIPVETPPPEDIPTEEPKADAEPQPPAIDKPVDKPAEEAKPAHPLPRRAQLTFVAYKGADFAIGEMRHLLEIGDDKNYTLRVGMNTTGLASLFKTYASEQQSSGILTAQGLRPGRFSETKNSSGNRETFEAHFAWEEKSLSFSNGSKAPLPEQAQDIVSFLYQLSQLPLDTGMVQMHISNGRKLERYELAVGEEEAIQTRLGRLRTLPLHKLRLPGEEGLDVWLGLEYRLLPVKIRLLDRAGQIAGEMVVSEIRVADE